MVVARPPSAQSKSAVADFDPFIEWSKPTYTRFRLGEGRGGGAVGHLIATSADAPPPFAVLL